MGYLIIHLTFAHAQKQNTCNYKKEIKWWQRSFLLHVTVFLGLCKKNEQ